MKRYGMQESEMGELAALMKAEPEGKLVNDEVLRLRNRFTDIHFSRPSGKQEAVFSGAFSRFFAAG